MSIGPAQRLFALILGSPALAGCLFFLVVLHAGGALAGGGGDLDGDGTPDSEDCVPWDPNSHPGAWEVCDGLDNDCDGVLPANEVDVDRDGVMACGRGGERADCDDLDPLIHPRRFEDCDNGLDDDCDGEIDEATDEDGDGVSSCEGDCDDEDAAVFPGAEETCDGVDNDCDGVADNDRDLDGDGFGACLGDCDEEDPERGPGAALLCDDGVPFGDGNCDGVIDTEDGDGDGLSACDGDCDDLRISTYPAALEYCDRRDNDCDGVIDEDYDVDEDGFANCHGDCDDQQAMTFPMIFEPNCGDGMDGDCDALLDPVDADCETDDQAPVGILPGPYGLRCDTAGGPSGGALAALLLIALGRRRRAAPRGLPLLALGLLPMFMPTAADAARKEKAVIIYLAGQPDMAAMVKARDMLGHLEAEDIVHSSELFTPVDVSLMVEGLAKPLRCPPNGMKPELLDSTNRMLDRLIQMDYRGALRIFDHVFHELPCLDSPLAVGVVADLLYYRGLAEMGMDRPGAAARTFRHVLGLVPQYKVDANFPPSLNAGFESVASETRTWPWVKLNAFAGPGSIIRVDGEDWDPSTGPLALHPGYHLVQYRKRGKTATLMMNLQEADSPFLIHAMDRTEGLRNARRSEPVRAWLQRELGLVAADVGVDLVAVVDLTVSPARTLYYYRADEGSFAFDPRLARTSAGRQSRSASKARQRQSRSSPKATARRTVGSLKPSRSENTVNAGSGATSGRSAARTRQSASPPLSSSAKTRPSAELGGARLRVRVAGGYAYLRPYSYALVPVEVSIRPVAGLHVDLGAELGVNKQQPFGLTVLPAGFVGASYLFDLGVFQPRIGALLRLGADDQSGEGDEPGVRAGWAGRMGFDLLPRGGRLLFSFDLQTGMYGKPFFVSATSGLGMRF